MQNKGMGLFATEPHSEGTNVFQDLPLFVVQHTGNRRMVAACANCCALVGSMQGQLECIFSEARFAPVLSSLVEAVPRWQAEMHGGAVPSAAVRCTQGCGELYCSEACRTAHFSHSHNILCAGPITSEEHPLIRFKYLALEHSDTLLLAAQVTAYLINRAKAAGGGAEVMKGMMAEFLNFCHAPFRDACRAPRGRGKDDAFLARTDKLIREAAELLHAALVQQAPGPEAEALFEAGTAFLSEVLGLFEYNNIDVEVFSPIAPFIARRGRALLQAVPAEQAQAAAELQVLEGMLREKEWVMKCTWGEETTGIFGDDGDDDGMAADAGEDAAMDEGGADDGGEEEDVELANTEMEKARAEVAKLSLEQLLDAAWPTFHGTGLYASVARLNHSCAPNVKVDFPENAARLRAFALRPIAPGEELCISYIEQQVDVQTRRRQLLEYGFNCICEKCLKEDGTAIRKKEKRLK